MFVVAINVVLSLAAAGAAGVLVVESARTGGQQIVFLGRTVLSPGSPEMGILILCGVSAAAALAFVSAVAHARGRRLERRMAAELDERYSQLAERDAGDAALTRLLEHRVDELQTSVDKLTTRRDALYEELRHLRPERTGTREALASGDEVVVVPEPDDVTSAEARPTG
jgi:hypothetical protein